MVHNQYQHAGGEDSVFSNEATILREAGHEVVVSLTSNDKINSNIKKVLASFSAIWSYSGYRRLARVLDKEKPDVVHVHNFFPYPSASLFWACTRRRIPVVWTLHNFRLMCANGLLYRDDRPCTDCVGRSPLPAIRYKCYRQSRIGSAVVAATILTHRIIGTWRNKVTCFIALTEFAKQKFIEAGLPPEKIVIKPNFSQAQFPSAHVRAGALYVGRLSPEKGVDTLIKAWANVTHHLTVIGDGPLRHQLEQIAGPNVSFVGQQSPKSVKEAMSKTQLLIVPSIWFENFPMTIVEGMAAATPILASDIGALSTIIEDGVTGLHFTAGSADDLARAANKALADEAYLRKIGTEALRHFQTYLSPERNCEYLEKIYRKIVVEYK